MTEHKFTHPPLLPAAQEPERPLTLNDLERLIVEAQAARDKPWDVDGLTALHSVIIKHQGSKP